MEILEAQRDIFTNLNEICFNKMIPLEQSEEKGVRLGKLMLSSSKSNRRVEEKCEVKVFLKRYICLKEDLSLRIYNKDYKNICKKNTDKMTVDEAVLRKCLLSLYDGDVVVFKISKELEPSQFLKAQAELKVTDVSLYEEFILYQIKVESVVFAQPAEPKSIAVYDRFIKKYQDEIRYFLSIDSHTEAISWSNNIISKFFNMRQDLKTQMTNEIKKKLLPEMKSVFLNKSMALMKKPGKDTNKDYEEVIKLAKEYYSHFPEKDDKYAKITKRLVKCYLLIKDYDTAESCLKSLSEIVNDSDVLELRSELAMRRNETKNKPKKNLLSAYTANYENGQDSISWEVGLTKLDLDCCLEQSVLNILK